jgi:membrane protein DedA with SNARE-associated domain
VDIACWAAITLSGLYYLLLLPFRAELVGTHPVVLEVLNGSTEAIVAGAAFARVGHGTLLAVLLAAIPGLMKFDPLYWWAGTLWGERAVALLGGRRNRGQRYLDAVKKRGRKVTWPAIVIAPFLPVPNAIIYVIAGWAGVSLMTFLVLDLIGTLLWTGMLAGLGYALGHHAVIVAQAVSRYGLWFSIAILTLIIVIQARSARDATRKPVVSNVQDLQHPAGQSTKPPRGPRPPHRHQTPITRRDGFDGRPATEVAESGVG